MHLAYLSMLYERSTLAAVSWYSILMTHELQILYMLKIMFFSYRGHALMLTFLVYTTYHLSRKPISVVKVSFIR